VPYPTSSVYMVLNSLLSDEPDRWKNHASYWYMASAMPDLRLPCSRRASLVPNYTAWWQKHVCEGLGQDCYVKVEQMGVKPAAFQSHWQATHKQSWDKLVKKCTQHSLTSIVAFSVRHPTIIHTQDILILFFNTASSQQLYFSTIIISSVLQNTIELSGYS